MTTPSHYPPPPPPNPHGQWVWQNSPNVPSRRRSHFRTICIGATITVFIVAVIWVIMSPDLQMKILSAAIVLGVILLVLRPILRPVVRVFKPHGKKHG
jgi:hypothetical protein